MTSSRTLRQLSKLSAIPRPIKTPHKPQQGRQGIKPEPKENWSGYNVLPTIGGRNLRYNINKNDDLHYKKSFEFDEISDSEFLYDEMTAEFEDMMEREARAQIIKDKAVLQFLELKSHHLDWVIKMARNNVWVPVNISGIGLPEKGSNDLNSEKDYMETGVNKTMPFDNGPTTMPGSPEMIEARLSTCGKDDAAIMDNSDLFEPKSSPRPTGNALSNIRNPTLTPSCSTGNNTTKEIGKSLVRKSQCYQKDQSPTKAGHQMDVPRSSSYTQNSTLTATDSLELSVPGKQSYSDGRSSNTSPKMLMPRPPACSYNASVDSHDSDVFVPRLPGDGKADSPIRGNVLTSVPSSPPSPSHDSSIIRNPDMFIPRPPSFPRDSRSSRIIRRPKAVPVLVIQSPILSPIEELSSSRKE